jgi:Phage Mu protein F like protein
VSDKFLEDDWTSWQISEPPPADPKLILRAMLAVADQTDSDEEAQAAIAALAAQLPRQHAETFAEDTPADIALPGAEGKRAAELLKDAQAHGINTLAELCAPAVERLLANAGRGGALFSQAELDTLAEALAGTLAAADLLGRARLRKLIDRTRKFSESTDLFAEFADPVPVLSPEAALDYFRALVPTLGVDPQRYGQDMRRQAFTLAVATEQTILDRVQALIAEQLQTGQVTTPVPAAEQVQTVLDAAGVTPQNSGYSEMVFRTNAADSYNQGAWNEFHSPDVAEEFPAWRYSNPTDSRSRPHHAEKDGNVYPSSQPFNVVRGTDISDVANCRCTFIPIHRSEM